MLTQFDASHRVFLQLNCPSHKIFGRAEFDCMIQESSKRIRYWAECYITPLKFNTDEFATLRDVFTSSKLLLLGCLLIRR